MSGGEYAIAAVALGLVMLGIAPLQYRRCRKASSAEPSSVFELTDGERAVLSGTGHCSPDLSEEPHHDGYAPFTDDRIVAAEYKIEDRDRATPLYDHEASGHYAPPFVLDDGTGQVLVVPDSTTTVDVNSREETIEVPANTEPPDRVKHYLEEASSEITDRNRLMATFPKYTNQFVPEDSRVQPVLDFLHEPAGSVKNANRVFGDHRKYTQQIVPDGGEVEVLGTARDLRQVGAEELGITESQRATLLDSGVRFYLDGDANLMIISDSEVSGVQRRGWMISIGLTVVGVLVLVAGILSVFPVQL